MMWQQHIHHTACVLISILSILQKYEFVLYLCGISSLVSLLSITSDNSQVTYCNGVANREL